LRFKESKNQAHKMHLNIKLNDVDIA